LRLTSLIILESCLQSLFINSVRLCSFKRVLLPRLRLLCSLFHKVFEIYAQELLCSMKDILSLLSHIVRLFLNYKPTFALNSISFISQGSKVWLKAKIGTYYMLLICFIIFTSRSKSQIDFIDFVLIFLNFFLKYLFILFCVSFCRLGSSYSNPDISKSFWINKILRTVII
jgi:hypothetical protein